METVVTNPGGGEPALLRRLLPGYAANPPLLAYVLGVVVVGCCALALGGGSSANLISWSFLLWLAISVGAEFLWLETISGEGTDSMSSTVNLSVLFIFGHTLSLWIIGLSVLLATRYVQKRDWVRSCFGLGQMAVTAFLAGLTFRAIWPRSPDLASFRSPLFALAMVTCAVVYFFANTFLVAGALSLERRTRFHRVWVRNYGYRNAVVSSVSLFTLSPLLLLSYLSIGYPGVLLFFLPLMIVKNQNREYINLQKMTQAMISSERMAAKGEMAAEVAHEIKNYLAVLSGRTQLLVMRAGRAGDDPMRRDADIIQQQVARMDTLAKGLLDFSHKEIRIQTFDLNKLVRDTLEFVQPQNLFDTVRLIPELDEEVGEVQADQGQIQQVLINLLRNAAEAMRDARRAAETDKPDGAGAPGHQVRIRTARCGRALVRMDILDNGPGMPPAVQAKVFEPAFTTKMDGHGYGLATCYRILQNHTGRIWVDSKPGEGAAFHLEFPRKAQEDQSVGKAAA